MKTRIAVGTVLLAASLASAGDVYVSPTGTAAGDGTKAKPRDIFSVISDKSPAKPGDTVYLMGGTYDGLMKGIERVPFEVKVSGAPDKPVRLMPAPGEAAVLNGSVNLAASYAQLIGLEIGDLQWDPWNEKHKTETALNVTGGESAKVINCNIFGGAMGTGVWSPAKNLELYGNLIHDFGYMERLESGQRKGRGHGHAYYAQNEEGTKIFQNNIAYRGCGWNVHIYTQGGQIRGFDVIGNICYIAGAYTEGQTMDNYLVYGKSPADRIRLIGNVGYQPSFAEVWRPNVRLANVYAAPINGTAVVQNNYFMGAMYGLSLAKWQDITVTGNTIWSYGIFMEISSAGTGSGLGEQPDKPDLKNYHVDQNTYVDNGKTNAFYFGNNERKDEGALIAFAQWQALGLDKNGRVVSGKGGKPMENKMFVFPNKYEKGRANVGVFNWEGKDKIEVDLSSALGPGRKFAVYNCLDIKQTLGQAKPIMTGVFDGKPVVFPMRKDPISPDFDAFLVVPL